MIQKNQLMFHLGKKKEGGFLPPSSPLQTKPTKTREIFLERF